MKRVQRALLVVLAVFSGASFGAESVAFITNMKGEVSLDGNPRPTLLSEVAKGQKIVLGKDAQASVMYIASGKEYVLKGPSEYLVKDVEVAATSGMPPVTRSTEWHTNSKVLVQVAQTSAASVRMRSIVVPKPDIGAKLLYPTQGNVATLQPILRWRTDDPKAQAELTLMLVGQDQPVHQVKNASGSYRVPAKLRPDTEYVWTVAVKGNEIGTGKFKTLSAESMRQVEKRRPSDKADFSDRLLFTLMLQEMGAVQEAQESWAKLSLERSDLPELATFAR